jgi:RNA polymerase sigma factor (sigma-70 family)
MELAESIQYKENFIPEEYFNSIYKTYSDKIYNLAYRMTGNEEIAEDITQETFIKVFNNYNKFRGESNIFTWIYSIAKNFCLQHLNKIKTGKFKSIEGLIEKVGNQNQKDQYEEIEKYTYIHQVKNGCLLGLLRCLSFYQRIAFILNILNEISIKDVSKIIDKSENSTRILICRARKNLRNFLCNNCSLYQKDNKCKCENLISFSLKQGWIKKYNPAVFPEIIESELKNFKNEIALYKTIPDFNRSKKLKKKIFNIIDKNNLNIFSTKKVK